jgi:hypothetical protein
VSGADFCGPGRELNMGLRLTPIELELLKELATEGRHGLVRPARRSGLARMVTKHCVTARPISPDTVLYIINDRGRRALADAMT